MFDVLYKADLARYGKNGPSKWIKSFLYYFRRANTESNRLLKAIYNRRYLKIARSHGIEIYPSVKIGPGMYIGHPYGITVNPGCVIGSNLNIHKGVTIGQENRGSRKGIPTIGNDVWIGVNSTIVGKIVIGDDVLISPNTFVNCDIPSHSVVVGNPCKIIPKENATECYINNRVQPIL